MFESDLDIQKRLNSMNYNSFKDMSTVPNTIVTEYLFNNEDAIVFDLRRDGKKK